MGTLHGVSQLQPKAMYNGAILKVKDGLEKEFLECYPNTKEGSSNFWGIFSNTFITNSTDGKVERIAMYSDERWIDFEQPGVFVSIQSGSKHGFGPDFVEFLGKMARFLENTLFYVEWDFIIQRYEINNGELIFSSSKDFATWDYCFYQFLLSNYSSSPKIIAEYVKDEIIEMQYTYNDFLKLNDDPYSIYDEEDFEELLEKLNNFQQYLSHKEHQKFHEWLIIRIKEAKGKS